MNFAELQTERFTFDLRFDRMRTEELAVRLSDDTFSRAPVREESLLSNWDAPNWIIEGSRVRQIRSRAQETESRRQRMLAESGAFDPFVTIQIPPIPILAFGDWGWTDYELRASCSGGQDGPAGVAFRYQDARHYYALTVEDGAGMRLVLRSGDRHQVLAQVPLPAPLPEYRMLIRVTGSELQAGLLDGPTVRVVDGRYAYGRAALVCSGESTYGPVEVAGYRVRQSELSLPAAPDMELLAEGALDDALCRSRVVFQDLDGDGLPELLADEHHGTEVHCQHLIHGHRWRLGPFEYPLSQGGDLPLCAFDIDDDGRREVVFTADFGIHVHDAVTGEHRATVASPPANPYREDADYPHERMLGDAISPVLTEVGQAPGFYVKDRYWNLWLYDRRLELLWHRALNTGHFPLPVQLRAGEPDYLFASRTLLSPAGDTVWSLDLPDHSDAIGLFALNAEPRFYVAAGEEGLMEIEPRTGAIRTQLKWGHVQQYALGRFLPGRPEPQILAITQWREPGIAVLLDHRLELISRWVEMSAEAGCRPLPWGTAGSDLAVNRGGILDPLTGRVVRPFPERCGRVRHLTVLDLPRYGCGCLLLVNESSWQIWGAGGNVPAVAPRWRPNALRPSGYLPALDF